MTAWCVARTYRRDLIGPDQPARLWVSGSHRPGPVPGLWAAGSNPSWVTDAECAALAPLLA